MCLHLCNWIDQQHPVQIDPYRSLIFCFSLFLIIFVKFHLLLHVFCFTEEDEDRWKTQRSLPSPFTFLRILAFSWNSGFFPLNLTLCGIPNFCEFGLLSWNSDFFGGNSDFYLGLLTFSEF